MKRLSEKEFVSAVMKNGTELMISEPLHYDLPVPIVEVWAHIASDGDIVSHFSKAEHTIKAKIPLKTQEEFDLLMNGELDEVEKNVITEELYPQYLAILKEIV